MQRQSDREDRSDYEKLVPAVGRIESQMGEAPGDCGWRFYEREIFLAMSERRIDLISNMGVGVAQSAGRMKQRGVDPSFYPTAFEYDAIRDSFRCPAGKMLGPDEEEKRPGRINYKYRACAADWQECAFREKCCPQNKTREHTIVRGVDAPEVSAFIVKMETEDAKKIYRQRARWLNSPTDGLRRRSVYRNFDSGV